MRITIEFERPRVRHLTRRRMAALALALAVLLPAGAYANHQFSDVPTSHTFHGDISRAKDAGLTSGCSPTTFCPEAGVTRGQMTAFLNRGLGRLARGNVSTFLSNSTEQSAGSVTIKAGNVTGAQAMVLLFASVNLYASGTGCHCEVKASFYRGDDEVSTQYYADIPAVPGTDNDSDEVLTFQAAVVVPTGVEQTYTLWLRRQIGTAGISGYGQVVALYVPFDGVGDAVSLMGVPDLDRKPAD